MKKTTIDWAPYIPDEWEEKRIKDISFLQSGNSITSDAIDETGLFPVYGGNGLRGYTNTYTNEGNYVLIGRQGALCGNINYAKDKFYASEHAVVVYPYCKNENTTWLGETLRAANLNRLSASAAQPGLAVSALNFVMIPYPPKSQREKIGKFLEEKIPLIDEKIELLRKKKNAYLRLKKSIINNAVTRGQDPYVKMKDSGIDWIGKIPEHWNKKRLKDCVTLTKGRTPNNLTMERVDLPYLTMDYLRDREGKDTMYPKSHDGLLKVPADEIIVLWDGANAGEFILSKEGYLGSTMALVECKRKAILKSYLFYLLKGIESDSKYYANGTTIPHFDASTIMSREYPMPPIEEQNQIATYLNDKCLRIDTIVENLEKQISRFADLKRALIDEVITGKRVV